MYFHPQGHIELKRKLYIILENKVVQKLKLPNNYFNKNLPLNQFFQVEKMKNLLWKSDFDTFWQDRNPTQSIQKLL